MTVWRLVYPGEQVAESRLAPKDFTGELDPCPIWVRDTPLPQDTDWSIFYLQDGRVYHYSNSQRMVGEIPKNQIYALLLKPEVPFDFQKLHRVYISDDCFHGVSVMQNTVRDYHYYHDF